MLETMEKQVRKMIVKYTDNSEVAIFADASVGADALCRNLPGGVVALSASRTWRLEEDDQVMVILANVKYIRDAGYVQV